MAIVVPFRKWKTFLTNQFQYLTKAHTRDWESAWDESERMHQPKLVGLNFVLFMSHECLHIFINYNRPVYGLLKQQSATKTELYETMPKNFHIMLQYIHIIRLVVSGFCECKSKAINIKLWLEHENSLFFPYIKMVEKTSGIQMNASKNAFN